MLVPTALKLADELIQPRPHDLRSNATVLSFYHRVCTFCLLVNQMVSQTVGNRAMYDSHGARPSWAQALADQ